MLANCFALTGGIACGKSVVAQLFAEAGWQVLDADDIVHQLEAPGGKLVGEICALAGHGVLSSSGGIDRLRLSERFFAEPELRQKLEALIHPVVKARFEEWPGCGFGPRLAVIPILFEVGWQGMFARVLCVTASEAVQVERMMRLRGMTREQSEARLRAQMPVLQKAALADVVIDNNGTLDELKQKVQALLVRLNAEWNKL